jgi:hypothetical protein
MWLIVKANDGEFNFKQLKAGEYPARCIRVIDLWTKEKEYLWQKKDTHEVSIWFEFPEELEVFDKEKWEQPYFLSKYFTLSLWEKANLRKFLESWRGRPFTGEELLGFDLKNLLWKSCYIQIMKVTTKDWNERSVINSILPLPKNMEIPDQINESIFFSFEDLKENWDEKILETLGEKTIERIKSSKEYINYLNVFDE